MTPSERNRLKRLVASLSSDRNTRHGSIPANADEWWSQIMTIIAERGITLTYAEWQEASAPPDSHGELL